MTIDKPLLRGVGIVDIDGIFSSSSKDKTLIKIYNTWAHMLGRCFSPAVKRKNPSYVNVVCVKEWYKLSVFKEWAEQYDPEDQHLDKDIIIKGNLVYGPDTCCFVPPWLNSTFVSRDSDRGLYPLGVNYLKSNKSFYARINKFNKRINLGGCSEPAEAHKRWQLAKVDHLKEIAEKYVEEKIKTGKMVDERVVIAILNRAELIQEDFNHNRITLKV